MAARSSTPPPTTTTTTTPYPLPCPQAILDAGALPVLVDLVGQGDMQVRLEAMWALRTILDGTPAQVHAAARGGVMPALVGALSMAHPQVCVRPGYGDL